MTTPFNLDAYRPGQHTIYDVAMDRILGGHRTVSAIAPCRYGKSDLMRTISFALQTMGRIGQSLAVSPNLALRNQMVSGNRVREMCKRYSIPMSHVSDYYVLSDLGESAEESHATIPQQKFVSCTMGLIQHNLSAFTSWAKFMANKGTPLLVHVDECHLVSGDEEKRWNEIATFMHNAGAVVVVYTATAIRSDSSGIFGFDWGQAVDVRDISRYVIESIPLSDEIWVREFNIRQNRQRLVADVEVTLKDAWSEPVRSICELGREEVDIKLDKIRINEKGEDNVKVVYLSELTASAFRKHAREICSHPLVIREMVSKALAKLASFREYHGKKMQMIVFTLNDAGGGERDNDHAHQIEETIQSLSPAYGFEDHLDCVICTLSSSENSGCELESFIDEGKGDVLLVKQMAGAGSDSVNLKVLLDLSTVRTDAACIQRWMRVATPNDSIVAGAVVTLADCITRDLWKAHISLAGGDWDGNWVKQGEDFVKEYKKKKEKKDREGIDVKEASPSICEDNQDFGGDAEWLTRAVAFRAKFHVSPGSMTDAELIRNMKECNFELDFGGVVVQEEQVMTATEQLKQARDTWRRYAKSVTDHIVSRDITADYKEVSKKVFGQTQEKVGWPRKADGKHFVNLPEIHDIKLLRRAIDAMHHNAISLGVRL